MFVPHWQMKAPILGIKHSPFLLIPHHDDHELVPECIGHLCGMFAPSGCDIGLILSPGLHLFHSDSADLEFRNFGNRIDGRIG